MRVVDGRFFNLLIPSSEPNFKLLSFGWNLISSKERGGTGLLDVDLYKLDIVGAVCYWRLQSNSVKSATGLHFRCLRLFYPGYRWGRSTQRSGRVVRLDRPYHDPGQRTAGSFHNNGNNIVLLPPLHTSIGGMSACVCMFV